MSAQAREEPTVTVGMQTLPSRRASPTMRRLFRERAKASHPDSPGGDEAAFKRVTAAWEAVQKHKSES